MERQRNELIWLDHPRQGTMEKDHIVIEAERYAANGARICCGSRNDNAPVLLQLTEEKTFCFHVKNEFDIKKRFDQCGLVVHMDDENCFRVMVEYMHENSRQLVGLATVNGVSDHVSIPLDSTQSIVYYRVIRNGQQFRVEYSNDGMAFSPVLEKEIQSSDRAVRIGAYVCSPTENYFRAEFSEMDFVLQ